MVGKMTDYIYIRSTDHVFKFLPKEAAKTESGRHWVRYLWPAEMVESARRAHPKRQAKIVQPVTVDLLAAIFGVNRSAKRFRDAAQMNYQKGTHGFAGNCKERKEKLYKLKDRGIVAAYRAGRLKAEGAHGVLTVYRGEGYCFHSLLRPLGIVLNALEFDANEAGCLYLEQKPKSAREPRLKDSVATLQGIPETELSDFKRLAFPPRPSKRRMAREDDDYYRQEDADSDDMSF
jgi:hypothetical protein